MSDGSDNGWIEMSVLLADRLEVEGRQLDRRWWVLELMGAREITDDDALAQDTQPIVVDRRPQ